MCNRRYWTFLLFNIDFFKFISGKRFTRLWYYFNDIINENLWKMIGVLLVGRPLITLKWLKLIYPSTRCNIFAIIIVGANANIFLET